MKKLTVFGGILAAAFHAFAAPAISATCTWKGPAAGGKWSDTANWRITPTPADESAAKNALNGSCAWVLTGLAEGATIENDLTKLRIGTLAAQTGAVTLTGATGSSFAFEAGAEITVDEGAAVTCTFIGNKTASSSKVIFLGKGTFDYRPADTVNVWENEFQPCANSTVRLGAANLATSMFQTWNTATFAVAENVNLARLRLNTGTKLVLENDATLHLTAGENGWGDAQPLSGAIMGTGHLVFSGGEVYNWSGATDYTGSLTLLNGLLNFHTTLPRTVAVKPQANGVMTFAASQDLGVLAGEGSTGGIKMGDGTTLTISGDGTTAASQYDARIFGKTDVVKDGSDYTLTLTGDNAYTGTTRVAAGTLELKRPTYRAGLVAQWSFDDENDLGRDAGPSGIPLDILSVGSVLPTQVAEGVGGRAAIWLGTPDDNAAQHQYLRVDAANLTGANGFTKKSAPFAVSFWMKPDLSRSRGDAYVFRRGTWSPGQQMMLWLNARTKTFRLTIDHYAETDKTLNIRQQVETIDDGEWHHIVAAYADNKLQLWYDGELLGETETSKALTFEVPGKESNDTTLVFGNPYSGEDHHLDSGIDEIRVWNRTLSAADVAHEYARGSEVEATVTLPEPIAHWRFDDADDLGKDEKGSSALIANAAVSGAPQLMDDAGAYGKALRGSLMRTSYPVGLPVGTKPFSVSIRLLARAATDGGTILAWGDTTHQGTYFRMWYAGSPRQMRVMNNGMTVLTDATESSAANEYAWVHYIVTCNPLTYVMRIYRDGRLISTVNNYWINSPEDGSFYVNATAGQTAASASDIDDLRIYDCELTPYEARSLARALKTGEVGPVLPSESAVTVEADATLVASGSHLAQNAVSGTGTVRIPAGSRFGAGDWSGFAGRIVGGGELVMMNGKPVPLAAESVEPDVSFADRTLVLSRAMRSEPLVRTKGRVILPTTGTIAFEAGESVKWGSVYKIAECSEYVGPKDTSGWKLPEGLPANAYGLFKFENGELILETRPRNFFIIIR